MSVFASAIAAGLESIGAVAGETIIYGRGVHTVEIENAVPGTSKVDSIDAGNAVIVSVQRDWVIKASLLVLNGSAVLPKRGDRITFSGTIYEVNVEGDEVWRWSDPGHTRVRIHTKQVPA